MSGSSTSKYPARLHGLPLLILLASHAGCPADVITLRGDARLSGELLAIDEQGGVMIRTPHSDEPLALRPDALTRISFTTPDGSPQDLRDLPSSVVVLNNGDRIPARIESLDETTLAASSPDLGSFQVPRHELHSLLLGLAPRRLIFAQNDGLNGWNRERDTNKAWSTEDNPNLLVSNGNGHISRVIEHPQHYILELTLKWTERPNFQVSFADPLLPIGQAADRYYLQFNGAGIEIKRESSTGRRHTTIALFNRPPDLFPDNTLKIEIRVDRSKSRLHVFFNDEPEGPFADPSRNMPDGNGIALISNTPDDIRQEISGLRLLEWDATGDRQRIEDRGDPDQDSLIVRSGERFGGTLTRIRPGQDGPVYSFKSRFQEDFIEPPEDEISTIFFSFQNRETPPAAQNQAPLFTLRLRGDGTLRVRSCSLDQDTLRASHPVIGPIQVRRQGLQAVEPTPNDAAPPKP